MRYEFKIILKIWNPQLDKNTDNFKTIQNKVLHKLDAWNKVGEGKAILIPIKVF